MASTKRRDSTRKAMITAFLRKRIIVAAKVVFDAERKVRFPIQPHVGLVLYNSVWCPFGPDESQEIIETIGYDLKSGHVECYLRTHDYRRKSSGGDWTEQEVREVHRDWTLKRNKTIRPK